MDITLEHKIINDKYTEYVYNTFDIQNKSITSVSIPMNLQPIENEEWEIGLIVGGSGSGKTTILKKLGDIQECTFNYDKSLISNFDFLEPKEATSLLSSMGLSSVPTWLRPFHLLSNGEQYRAKLAYLVGTLKDGDTLLVDEFTSVVDRAVAKSMSCALSKYIRRSGKKIVLASCHYDIIEWLNPNWVYSPMNGKLEFRRLARRPNIKLSVSRVESSAWNLFKEHHYLTQVCSKGFGYLMFSLGDKPVAICVYKPQPTGAVPNGYALARTVVLPDFQGMGIGVNVSNFVASILVNMGKRVYTKTINPALGEYRGKSERFRPTAQNGKTRKFNGANSKDSANRLERASYCHEYIGEGLRGYKSLLDPIKEMRDNKKKEQI